MVIPRRIQRTVALCVLTAWASLCCLHLADALEDAQEGPEPMDVLVTQALATPAEQPASLSETSLLNARVSPDWAVVSTPAILNLHPVLARGADPYLPPAEGPPPRAKPPFFQLFSVYRL